MAVAASLRKTTWSLSSRNAAASPGTKVSKALIAQLQAPPSLVCASTASWEIYGHAAKPACPNASATLPRTTTSSSVKARAISHAYCAASGPNAAKALAASLRTIWSFASKSTMSSGIKSIKALTALARTTMSPSSTARLVSCDKTGTAALPALPKAVTALRRTFGSMLFKSSACRITCCAAAGPDAIAGHADSLTSWQCATASTFCIIMLANV
mmetsp:Transcript_48402/g.122044  ORF Transcript_48402/g.122044 Transcript_48402/m.122044 type:complete len:214 (+) Transcript_48402:430-1071(+)